jgi:hypothetical protein
MVKERNKEKHQVKEKKERKRAIKDKKWKGNKDGRKETKKEETVKPNAYIETHDTVGDSEIFQAKARAYPELSQTLLLLLL